MRVLSLVLAVVAWLCSGLALLLGLLWGLGLKCDDACGVHDGWRGDPDAWQWNLGAVLGGVTFVAGCALVLFVWRRRRLWAALAVVIGGAAAIGLMNPFSDEWIDHLDRRSLAELLLMLTAAFAPILSVLFAVEPRQRR
jgi:hypothetical protein